MKLVACAIGASLALAVACDDTGSYTFVARELDPRGCLGAVTALDVLSGSLPGLGCKPRCFVSHGVNDAGRTSVFGTTMCGAAPPSFDTTEADPRCTVAKAAVSRGDLCLADGGDTSPPDASIADARDGSVADASTVDTSTIDAADATAE